MNRGERTERERPFNFTIEVEAVAGGWVARVDADGNEKEFVCAGRREAEMAAEAFCRDYALTLPGARHAYSYDYSPLVTDRNPA
jgi:hypothetical protein